MPKQTKPIEYMGGYQPLPLNTPPDKWRTGEGYVPLGGYKESDSLPIPPRGGTGVRRIRDARTNNQEMGEKAD